jgi:class 3 adenylate cyclase/tetratricopeptide (TPR) repeat protein
MDFYAVLDQAVDLLRQRGRVTYRALKLQFQLDDDQLEALKDELLYAHPQVADDAGRGLLWSGSPEAVPPPAAAPALAQDRAPLSYTPPHLAEQILTSRAALEGERKQVTVLFADLKGSMELLAERDPEEARHLLDPVLDRMMAAVHQYEGTVNQVMGDGIMALFGAPLAHEDHAVRACYAALRVQEAVKQYATEVQRTHGVPLHIRVGLNAGEVVVRSIGSDLHMDYTAVGQTTHLAARMEQMAMPGAILITPAVLGLVEGFVQVKALGAMPVRGLRDPVEVYEVTGASVVRSRLQVAAARGLTRFVGRQHELETLQQALAQAQAGHGQVVAMVGEAGVGKSRLLYEFGHSHHTQGWLVLESASVSYGKATPYFPVVDLLKRYCHIEERDDPRTVRAKVTGQILTLDETLQATIPALLALLDALPADSPFLTLDPPQRRQRTLDGLKHLLLRESQVQPLLLIFEDLHWIDTETQAMLDSLVESLPTAQLLLLVNYRPEYQHGWGSKTYYRQLRLDPLPPASADAFLQALLGDGPSLGTLRPLLIARTGGNPFFLEESVRTLVETGMLVGAPGAYRLPQPLASLQMPATVQAVLAARIDRLPPEEKHVLQTAAVIGTEVPLPLLQVIAELPEADLHRSLAHLQAAEFLYETRLFPEREFTFKHALTHEVAYNGLLQERRRVLHTRIVEALEALSPDRLAEQVERLAHHAMRGEAWDKALAYNRQAGTRVTARSAYREAVAYFEQALTALAQLPEHRDTLEQAIDLRLDLRNVLFPLDEHARIFDHLCAAEALAERLDDPQRFGWIACYLCISFSAMSEHDRAIAAGQRALALATTSGAFDVQVVALTYLGVAYYAAGDFRQTLDVLRRVTALLTGEWGATRFGTPVPPAVISRGYMAGSLAALGDFAEGRDVAEETVRLAEAVEQPFSIAAALWYAGLVYRRQGALHTAIPMLERSMEIYQTANIPMWRALTASILGAAYALAGRAVEALPLLDEVLERVATGRLLLLHALVLTELSEACLLVGHVDEASALAGRLLELSRTHTGSGYQAHACRLLGEVAMRRDPPDVDQATAHYRQALALAEELGMRPLQAHCHLGLGTLYAKTDQRQQAHAELSTAIDLYRAMDMTFWLPQAKAALVQTDGAEGSEGGVS